MSCLHFDESILLAAFDHSRLVASIRCKRGDKHLFPGSEFQ